MVNRQLIIVIFFCLSSLGFTASLTNKTANELHWKKPQYIEHSFYEIALQNEFNTKRTRVRKWTKPLAIYIEHEVGDQELHLRLIKMHFTHLKEITHLPISYVKNKSKANFRIF